MTTIYGFQGPAKVEYIKCKYSMGRFTPTGVGTTTHPTAIPSPRSVHPHGRGDHLTRGGRCTRSSGSPPRAWGPLPVLARKPVVARFTPTGVGTTTDGSLPAGRSPVHPHGRGDHGIPCAFLQFRRGSPPRAWGPPSIRLTLTVSSRFTPTGVGTTIVEGG